MNSSPLPTTRIAVIVNPIAGIGGKVALHGSDEGLANRALELGAQPRAESRMVAALRSLRRHSAAAPQILAATGSLGGDAVRRADLTITEELPRFSRGKVTTAADSRHAAETAARHAVDLILFAGGDGTAADIADAVGETVPILGVPSGVKMHSGVFAIDPERAGRIAARFLDGAPPRAVRTTDVVDVVETGGPTRIGTASVPRVGGMQNPKAVSPPGDGGVRALGRLLADQMEPGRLYLIGPGSSAGAVLEALGLTGTLNGVDVVLDRQIISHDATEAELLQHLDARPHPRLILGVVGGQGFLLGRGNQQISSAVLERIDESAITIVAPYDKVAALQPPVLHVDVDDPARPLPLPRYCTVFTSPSRSIVMRLDHDEQQRGWA